MFAATYTQDEKLQLEELSMPDIRDDEMLLRVQASSICGTDLRIIQHGHHKLQPGQKIVLGHEFSGTIETIGSRVQNYHLGQRVAVAPNVGCGLCSQCIAGKANMCPHYKAFGISFNGSHAEFVKIPASAISQGNVMPLPDEVSFEEASLNEPLSCVINSISACRIVLGDTIAIFGAGPMGLLHLMLAKLSGAGVVIVCDIMDDKLERARELGADHIINPQRSDPKREILSLTQAQGADVVVTACPAHSVQEEAIEVAAPFGRICFFGGLPHKDPKITINSNLIHYRNLIVTGVTGGSNADYNKGLRLLVEKKINLTDVVSATYPLSQAAEAFQTALTGRALRIILRPHG